MKTFSKTLPVALGMRTVGKVSLDTFLFLVFTSLYDWLECGACESKGLSKTRNWQACLPIRITWRGSKTIHVQTI